MISRRSLHLTAVIALAIALGVGAGVIRQKRQQAAPKDQPTASLNVLSLKGIFSEQFREKVFKDLHLKVELTEVDDAETLLSVLEASRSQTDPHIDTQANNQVDHQFDVATLDNRQLGAAQSKNLLLNLRDLDSGKITNTTHISPDFTGSTGKANAPHLPLALPILWGVTGVAWPNGEDVNLGINFADLLAQLGPKRRLGIANSTENLALLLEPSGGKSSAFDEKILPRTLERLKISASPFSPVGLLQGGNPPNALLIHHGEMTSDALTSWHFQIPKQGASIWILSLAGLSSSNKAREIEVFLNGVFSRELTLQLIQDTHQASTNRLIEAEVVDSRLKPSSLRQFPLPSLLLKHDLWHAGELRAALQEMIAKEN